MPPSANSGRKTRTTRIVAKTIDERTSLDASLDHDVRARASGFAAPARFSRSRRNTFSTSTMASSTSSPMATASPPSVIVLIDDAERLEHERRDDDRERDRRQRDRGRAEVEQEQEQHDHDEDRPVAERLLDVADGGLDEGRLPEHVRAVQRRRPRGSVALDLVERARRASSVSATVLAPGCFSTERITPGRPSTPASPRRVCGAAADLGHVGDGRGRRAGRGRG